MATKHDPVRVRIMMFKPTHDILEFMTFICGCWEYHEHAEIIDKGDHYTFRLATVGLSDNEKIISQLMSSFFRIYWKKSTSSGKHIFKLNKDGSVYFKSLSPKQ